MLIQTIEDAYLLDNFGIKPKIPAMLENIFRQLGANAEYASLENYATRIAASYINTANNLLNTHPHMGIEAHLELAQSLSHLSNKQHALYCLQQIESYLGDDLGNHESLQHGMAGIYQAIGNQNAAQKLLTLQPANKPSASHTPLQTTKQYEDAFWNHHREYI